MGGCDVAPNGVLGSGGVADGMVGATGDSGAMGAMGGIIGVLIWLPVAGSGAAESCATGRPHWTQKAAPATSGAWQCGHCIAMFPFDQ